MFAAGLVDGVGAESPFRSSELRLLKVSMVRCSCECSSVVIALSCDCKASSAVSQDCFEVAPLSTVEDIVGILLIRNFTSSMN